MLLGDVENRCPTVEIAQQRVEQVAPLLRVIVEVLVDGRIETLNIQIVSRVREADQPVEPPMQHPVALKNTKGPLEHAIELAQLTVGHEFRTVQTGMVFRIV